MITEGEWEEKEVFSKDAWGDAWDKIEDRVAAVINGEKLVIYSAYEDDENGNPADNLDKIAAEGKVVLICKADWSDKGKDYRSEVLENPTWMQVAICANEMIKITNDYHHVFLERISYVKKEDGVNIYELQMGS
jgi:DICT domain-containing protein